jgi:hypothetical protein
MRAMGSASCRGAALCAPGISQPLLTSKNKRIHSLSNQVNVHGGIPSSEVAKAGHAVHELGVAGVW